MSWHTDSNGEHHRGTPGRNVREFNPGAPSTSRKRMAAANFYGHLPNTRGRVRRNFFRRGTTLDAQIEPMMGQMMGQRFLTWLRGRRA